MVVVEGVTAEIRFFVGSKPPRGWAFCSGQTLGRVAYASLFGELGNRFGGDGHTSFKLPHLTPLSGESSVAYIICISGLSAQDEMPLHLGEITLFAGNSKPNSRLVCHGQLLLVDEYMPLFSVIGHQFGGGENEFQLPDLGKKEPHPDIHYWISALGEFPI